METVSFLFQLNGPGLGFEVAGRCLRVAMKSQTKTIQLSQLLQRTPVHQSCGETQPGSLNFTSKFIFSLFFKRCTLVVIVNSFLALLSCNLKFSLWHIFRRDMKAKYCNCASNFCLERNMFIELVLFCSQTARLLLCQYLSKRC